jgi:small multidrug resistance pump
MQGWVFLAVAILAEIIGTSFLRKAEGFTRLMPSLVVMAGYAIACYFLALAVRSIPVAIAYAIWAGLGTALIALIGWLVLGQRLDLQAIGGLVLIVVGVVMLNLSSSNAVQ